jgi:hypothetical protein
MRVPKLRTCLAIGAAPGLAVAIAVPAAALTRGADTHAAAAANSKEKVILVLRDQPASLPARSPQRFAAVRSAQAPVIAELAAMGVRNTISTSILNTVTATVPKSALAALAADPAVSQVIPVTTISVRPPQLSDGPARGGAPARPAGPGVTPPSCGTSAKPELDPEALANIHATPAELGSVTGAGVSVASIADGVDPANPDFQRNAAFASAGHPAGSPVVTQVDFSGDPLTAPTLGGEMFGDASAIAAQGNQTYDLANFVNVKHPLPPGCDIKIVGVAPGASVLALKAFAQNLTTTNSNLLQAINYAATHGVKVINESFGSTPIPDGSTADMFKEANDAAVAAGITVVVSSGDAGFTTGDIGSPSSDPNVISAGASTTFRIYAQEAFGGINDPAANGKVADNNISSLSSGGFTQAGATMDLVAPGDLGWAVCTPNLNLFLECSNDNGAPSPIEPFGGTSQSAPLTSAAAADVIQAYASKHGGVDPSPALVKQILISTATDLHAPATEQGAGLLNVAAAVKMAKAVGRGSATPNAGLRIGPNQINVQQRPGGSSVRPVSLTNTGSTSVIAHLSTRALTRVVGNSHGTFCMQPDTANPTAACPANSPGVLPIWSGANEVFQNEHFTVPRSSRPDVLEFSADYRQVGQTSLLHFGLLGPDGTYEAYSLPQGDGGFGTVEVSNPRPGPWTALFFTEQDGFTKGAVGTSGPVQWSATTKAYVPASAVSPATITIPAGATRVAHVTITSPGTAGDTSESVVVSAGSQRNTVPVTIRTVVPTDAHGGQFTGILTGGNGRPNFSPAQENTYVFNVPRGERDLNVEVQLQTDPNDFLIAYLENPEGQIVGTSDNLVGTSLTPQTVVASPFADLYHTSPQAGQWRVLLQFVQPVPGTELTAKFRGVIRFNSVSVGSNLPRAAALAQGKSRTFTVHVTNTSHAPQAYFVDPRLNQDQTISLLNLNPGAHPAANPLPLPPPDATTGLPPFPFYIVPSHTSGLAGSVNETSGTANVNFELSYGSGDPDLEGVSNGTSASLSFLQPEVGPGLWVLDPTEIGPFAPSGAPAAVVSENLDAVTKAFDPAVISSTGDMWSALNGLSKTPFAPVFLKPGQSAAIKVTITPTASVGSDISGTLYVSNVALGQFIGAVNPDSDDIAAIPYHYDVVAP